MTALSRCPLEGVLVLRKDAGPSSNAVLQHARRLLGGVKAGHAGTLDPAAEGVLLLCLGGATRLVPFLADLVKEYVGRMRFGEETDTLDGEGRVVSTAPVGHVTETLLRDEMLSLVGDVLQYPPMYSAVKVSGRRLYEMARQGKTVERSPRAVRVLEFALLRWQSPEMEFRVRCGGGTYIRSLCHDLAVRCRSRGHMTSLTRTAVGPFRLEDAVSLERLAAAAERGEELPLVSPARALAHLPVFPLESGEARRVLQGGRPLPPGGAEEDLEREIPVRLTDERGSLVAVARYDGPGVPMPLLRVFTAATNGGRE